MEQLTVGHWGDLVVGDSICVCGTFVVCSCNCLLRLLGPVNCGPAISRVGLGLLSGQ